jgi:DNA-binding NarL/FixJ family response regulator
MLVDDHALVRRGFRRLLEDEADLEVIGEAGTGTEALSMALELRPDVMVLDFALPEMNGVMVARNVLAQWPEANILMLSMHAEPQYAQSALDAGARGYLLKNAMDLDLVNGIRAAAAGDRVLDPQIVLPAHGSDAKMLTKRELEVLQHIVDGKSNKQIAGVLGLSVNTVSVHRANIMDRLGAHNAAELIGTAVRLGLATLPA